MYQQRPRYEHTITFKTVSEEENYEMAPRPCNRSPQPSKSRPKRKMSSLLSSKKIQDYISDWPEKGEDFIDMQTDPIRKMSEHHFDNQNETFMN